MSKVKFIQWGTPESPKTYNDYTTSFESIKDQYPGGVIFVTYTDDKNKQKQEIWANGVQYSVGGSGGGNIIYGTTAPNAAGVVTVDGSEVKGADGYIYIYTTLDSQTAYYWKDNKWVAFEVDAEHIWFHEDITLAGDYTRIGNFTKSQTGTSSVYSQIGQASGSYNLKTLLEKLLSKEESDSSSWEYTFSSTLSGDPSVTFTVKSGDLSGDYATVGTVITVSNTTPTSSATQSASVSPRFGYYLGTSTEKKTVTKTVSGTPTASSGAADSVSLTKSGKGSLSNGELTVAAGQTTVTATASGKTYNLDTTVTDPVVTPLTNLGNKQTSLTLDTTNWGQSSTTVTASSTTGSKSVTGVYPVYFEGASLWPTRHSANIKNAELAKTKSNTESSILEVPTSLGGTLQVKTPEGWKKHDDYTTNSVNKTVNGNTVAYTQYIPSAANGTGTLYKLV